MRVVFERRRSRRGQAAWGLIPVGLAVGLGAWSLGFGLPFAFRPDEDLMVGASVRMAAQGSLDPQYAVYPPLSFYLFAAAEKIAGDLGSPLVGDPTRSYLAARAVALAAFVAAVGLTFLAGWRAHGTASALLSGSALALAPLAVRQAHFATADIVEAALVAAAICAAAWARTARGLALAGALCGLAAAAKEPGGLALLVVLAMAWPPRPRRRWAGLAPPVVAAAAAFAVACAVAILHPTAYAGAFGFLLDRGYARFRDMPLGLVYHATVTLPFGLGLGTMALAVAGMAYALLRRERFDLGLVAFLGVSYLVEGLGHEDFFRYMLPLLPAFCLLAGGLLRAVPTPALGPGLGVGLLLLLPSAWASVATDRLLSRTDTRQQAAAWIEANVPAGTSIESPYYGGPFYSRKQIAENRRFPPGSLAADFLQGRYTARYRIDGPSPRYRILASGPPDQAPLPRVPPCPPARPGEAGCSGTPVAAFSAGRSGGVYDRLDSFYVPIWGLELVDRPGPSIVIVRLPGRAAP
jgi:hypothetical protein